MRPRLSDIYGQEKNVQKLISLMSVLITCSTGYNVVVQNFCLSKMFFVASK
jgi:hypothetical protein